MRGHIRAETGPVRRAARRRRAGSLVLGILCWLSAACLGPRAAPAPAVLRPASAAEFRQIVQQSRKPLVAVFTSESCVACRTMGPTLEGLAADYAGRVQVVHADLALTGGLIQEYDLLKVPTVIVIRDGREMARRQSLLPPIFMRPFIDEALRRKPQ